MQEGVTNIGYLAFENLSDLKNVYISNSVTLIDVGAFYNCRNLISIIIPESIYYNWVQKDVQPAGSMDYNELENKPSNDGVTLTSGMSASDFYIRCYKCDNN